MKYFANGAFYDSKIHTTIPAGAAEITDDEWRALLAGQADGKLITTDDDGKPVLSTAPDAEADTGEWVDLEAFITALYGLVPAETLQTTLLGSADALKSGIAGLALLTTNAVRGGKLNLLDSRVEPLLAIFGLTLDAVRSAMNTITT